MTTQESAGIVAQQDINVVLIRLTAFFSSNENLQNPSWWQELLGVQPESRTSRPSALSLQETGLIEGKGLALTVNPGRVDWFIGPAPQKVPTSPLQLGELPLIPSRWAGPVNEILPLFDELMQRWLKIIPGGVTRLAFGLTLDIPAQSRIQAYQILSRFLPSVEIDPENSSDLLYQINRFKKSNVVSGLTINRLGKWAAVIFVPVNMSMIGGQITHQQLTTGEQTCRVEVDINTNDVSSTDEVIEDEIPHSLLGPLFDELKQSAIDIITKGDIK